MSFLLLSLGREPGWIHLEEQVRSASLCLPICLDSHTPQTAWHFSASTNLNTHDYDVSPNRITGHTPVSHGNLDSCKWEGCGCDGVRCLHAVLLDSSTLRGKKKQIVFYCVEGQGFSKFSLFNTWIIFFELWFAWEGQALRKSSELSAANANSHPTRQGARQPGSVTKAYFKSLKWQTWTSRRKYLYSGKIWLPLSKTS